ncbi:hypothetical protein B0T11DRAFT_106571 [Plectosphaerella cucumerina]|uniref:GDP/GTP exchange factor Sec2 N-terminal domain-containing protein n=1 Tax=Plectosphaerella cucumerina TaxID=40658 RepID=A0A8K0X2P6_9PEZI|nr:hypothetical protein B0T11DRAFT_106571 [Plectosphaerella cucumerina]
MESFIAVAGWSQPLPASSNPNRSYGHFRSRSTVPTSSSPRPPRTPARHPSVSDLSIMSDSPRLRPLPPSPAEEEAELSTLPDPRSRAMSPAISLTDSPHHPDLNAEVATLSTKLINAINYQTTLDDTLSATRSELEQAREQIKVLEERNATQREMLAGDVWVRKKAVEQEKQKLLARVSAEQKHREDVEAEKKKMELELETLTTALFEEANKMVVTAKEEARKEQDLLHKKNDQLRAQIADTEGLLKFQQEQLAELKNVMEQMTIERDEHAAITAPSSPGLARSDGKEDERPGTDGLAPHSSLEPVSPSYATSFSHLILPVLRTDLASYEDFTALARLSRSHAVRVSSGSMAAAARLGSIGGSTSSAHPSNASTTSLPALAAASSPQSPNTPISTTSHASAESTTPALALKDSRYYKRVLTEDVEPTLRLDAAPGLSWLARRSVLSAMAEGSIVVEPIPSSTPYSTYIKPQFYACSICGDSRKEEQFLRYHRFRTSENESAQRYPLCKFCLNRVRSTCDFLSFLRILRDGHWRTERDDIEKAAWEESVRLREQMFWARIGGGVVPAGHPVLSDSEKSPRPSHESGRQPEVQPSTPPRSPASATITETPATPDEAEPNQLGGASLKQDDEEAAGDPNTSTKTESDSTLSVPEKDAMNPADPAGEESKRLSLTIPTVEKTSD